MPSITITWDATLDMHTCPICRALHGYSWTFTTPDPMPDELVHPAYGVVWNKVVGSKAHGHQRFNCRCSIIPRMNVSDVLEQVQLLKQELEMEKRFE